MEPLAIAGLAGSVINAQNQNMQNMESQRYSQYMYEKQRRDNIIFWNMQNAYNSPQAQMKRFQEAGLNPNLIYGQGNSGPAGNISTPDVQPVQFRSPEFGNALTSGVLGMMQGADLKIKNATYNNLLEQNTVLKQEGMLKAAQTLSTLTGEEKTRWGLQFEQMMADISADYRREQLRATKIGTDLSINKDTREAAMTSSNINEAVERMAKMREERANTVLERQRIRANVNLMYKDGTLKDLDINLKKMGIQPSDPMYARIVSQGLSYLLDDSKKGDFRAWMLQTFGK